MIRSKAIKTITSRVSVKSFLMLIGITVALSIVLVNKQEKFEPKPRVERYFISSKDYPRFTEAVFNPFDFRPGEEQIVLIKIENPEPVESVTAIVKTDNATGNYELKLATGSATSGTWKGVWKIKDTHGHTYRETFKATSENDKSQVDLVFK